MNMLNPVEQSELIYKIMVKWNLHFIGQTAWDGYQQLWSLSHANSQCQISVHCYFVLGFTTLLLFLPYCITGCSTEKTTLGSIAALDDDRIYICNLLRILQYFLPPPLLERYGLEECSLLSVYASIAPQEPLSSLDVFETFRIHYCAYVCIREAAAPSPTRKTFFWKRDNI